MSSYVLDGFNIPEGTRNIAISNSIFVSYIKSYGQLEIQGQTLQAEKLLGKICLLIFMRQR